MRATGLLHRAAPRLHCFQRDRASLSGRAPKRHERDQSSKPSADQEDHGKQITSGVQEATLATKTTTEKTHTVADVRDRSNIEEWLTDRKLQSFMINET